jgi:hypothetical protein
MGCVLPSTYRGGPSSGSLAPNRLEDLRRHVGTADNEGRSRFECDRVAKLWDVLYIHGLPGLCRRP